MTKIIQISKGLSTIVDDDIFEEINIYKWQAVRNGLIQGKYYVQRTVYCLRSDGTTYRSGIKMHRQIIDAPKNMLVDHINGNTLDNRMQNLRLCTSTQNQLNRIITNGKSIYKGVTLVNGKWVSRLTFNGKRFYLGNFESEKDAAIAYNNKAIEIAGQFSFLNNIPEENLNNDIC